jgi:hypothetical protein
MTQLRHSLHFDEDARRAVGKPLMKIKVPMRLPLRNSSDRVELPSIVVVTLENKSVAEMAMQIRARYLLSPLISLGVLVAERPTQSALLVDAFSLHFLVCSILRSV